MSNLLKEAIQDAQKIKEISLKNAERKIMESIEPSLKAKIFTLLEADESMDLFSDLEDDGGEDLDLGADLQAGEGEGGDSSRETESIVNDDNLPSSFEGGDDVVEVDLSDIGNPSDPELGEESLMEEGEIDPAPIEEEGEEVEVGTDTDTSEEDFELPDTNFFEKIFSEILSSTPAEELLTDGLPSEEDGEEQSTEQPLEEAAYDRLVNQDGNKGGSSLDVEDAEAIMKTQEAQNGEVGDPSAKTLLAKELKVLHETFSRGVNKLKTGFKAREKELLEKINTLEGAQYILENYKEKQGALLTENKKLKSKLSESNLVGTRLLYFSKILADDSLNDKQKESIIVSLKECTNTESIKVVYETLLKTPILGGNNKKRKINLSESNFLANRSASFSNSNRATRENGEDVEPDFDKNSEEIKMMQLLAGITKQKY